MNQPTPRHPLRFTCLLLAGLALAAPLSGCGSSSDSSPGEPSAPVSSILPGEEIPVDRGITLVTSGTYGIPAGSFELVMLCDLSLDFEAVAENGTTTTGQCSTGIVNTPVAGPGGLTLTFVEGASVLLTITPTST